MFRSAWFAVLMTMCACLGGCKHSTEKIEKGTKQFPLRGTIVAIDAAQGEITLQHDAIPGFMEAMTMPYKLVYAQTLKELHPGDLIRARLLVDQTDDGDYRNGRIDEIAVIAQARPNFKPSSNYNVPTPGQPVPDFHFVNQDNKRIDLKQFAGKALLVTFIYTRCPLGDFCPKMSRNFAAIETLLEKDPSLKARTALLSISFDPVFDTPAVLRAYGSNYTGKSGFGHWQFAAPTKDALPEVERFFNVGATGEGADVTHSLSTVLIGGDGKVAEWYAGSEWKPDEVAAKMRTVAEKAAA